MAGTVSLPLKVEIAFGADPMDTGSLTWTNITGFVRRESVSFSRGWDTEAREPLAGRASLSLNNDSGDFTPGASGLYGQIRPRLPLRISQGATVLWTGLVDTLSMSFTNGFRPRVDVVAIDRWAQYRRIKLHAGGLNWGSRVGASAYWPLTGKDLSGLTRVVSSAGWATVALTSPLALTADAELHKGPFVDDPSLAGAEAFVSGPFSVESGCGGAGGTKGSAFSLWVKPTGVGGTGSVMIRLASKVHDGVGGLFPRQFVRVMWNTPANASDPIYPTLAYGGDGAVDGSVTASGGTFLKTGEWACLTVRIKANNNTPPAYGGITASMSIAGVGFDRGTVTRTDTLGMWHPEDGADYFDFTPSGTSTPVVAYLSTYPSAEIGTVGGFSIPKAGDLPRDRVAMVAGRGGVLGSVSLGPAASFAGVPMSLQDLSDKPLADALLECVSAEGGVLSIGPGGWPVFRGRRHVTGSHGASVSVPVTVLDREASWVLDDQQLVNVASVDRMALSSSAGTSTYHAAGSVSVYGERSRALQLWLWNDRDAAQRAADEATKDSEALVRSTTLSVDLLTCGASVSVSQLLAVDVGDRLTLTGLPDTAPDAAVFSVDSISDQVSETKWLRTFSVSPVRNVWTLGNATLGKLDSGNGVAF